MLCNKQIEIYLCKICISRINCYKKKAEYQTRKYVYLLQGVEMFDYPRCGTVCISLCAELLRLFFYTTLLSFPRLIPPDFLFFNRLFCLSKSLLGLISFPYIRLQFLGVWFILVQSCKLWVQS